MPGFTDRALKTTPFPNEEQLVKELADKARLSLSDARHVESQATALVQAIRSGRQQAGGIEEFMQEYELSSREGLVLMCLAEALLRIPDAKTADKLIADKIGGAAWEKHLGNSQSLFVNASTWGLMLTGTLLDPDNAAKTDSLGYLTRLVSKAGEPVIRRAMRHAMKIMGKQFVLGRNIAEAMDVAKPMRKAGYRFSFDMLGEAAHTKDDAEKYFLSYQNALEHIAKASTDNAEGNNAEGKSVFERPSISIKLSAIHPRYDEMNLQRVLNELVPKLTELAKTARRANLGLTIDAEEVDRLDLSLDVFKALAEHSDLDDWNGLGLAVQAYSRRALPVLEWLGELAHKTSRIIPIRLVKGAYWDTEIKRAQEAGYSDYPVFTRKVSTDVSYLACAKFMLANRDRFYPQFASHNAHTLAAVSVMAKDKSGYECQRLHGMGQALFDQVTSPDNLDLPARIYAPVGSHEDLLAYLVRRLLENGANSSFVNRLSDDQLPIEEIIADPVAKITSLKAIVNPQISPPVKIFAPRQNSKGIALWHQQTRQTLITEVAKHAQTIPESYPLIDGKECPSENQQDVVAPYDHSLVVGRTSQASENQVNLALSAAASAQQGWNAIGGTDRAKILRKAADLYEANQSHLITLLLREAGKTLDNALGDIREAVDFLRYYADQAQQNFTAPTLLPGPTGESNEHHLQGRGVFTCIAPWNFPLAIFTGQISAALAAGNAVVAKPAEQTPLIGFAAVKLLHEAGVHPSALQFLPGSGATIGSGLVADVRTSGVAFTGSTETARKINQVLANRQGSIATFIAETGGMNAMLADSSALPEQVVSDVVYSAFDSAGQRCSAARILFLQADSAKRIIAMLQGATEELRIGNPQNYATDVGPVIDQQAKSTLEAHKAKMATDAKTLIDLPLPEEARAGTFVSPAIYQLDDISSLKREVFGPVLHVVTYQADRLDKVCDAINNTGYGLTFGLHTRIEQTAHEVSQRIKAGNIYINRNQIGAVVGAQPFGGHGLSGTGPKAGGPPLSHSLCHRNCHINRHHCIGWQCGSFVINWMNSHLTLFNYCLSGYLHNHEQITNRKNPGTCI